METFLNRRRKRRKKQHNERLIKDKIIRDIRALFEQEEDYYKPKRVSSFWITATLNMKIINSLSHSI